MARELKIKVSVYTVPHPNPKAAYDVVAKIVVKQLEKQAETNKESNQTVKTFC